MMDKAKSLRVEPKLDLVLNGELKSMSLINMTHPSLEEAVDKINSRVTNPREILDNKMTNKCHKHGIIETMFSHIDIHEESTLELKKEDNINEHGSYFINILVNPCSYEKSPKSIVPQLPHTRSSTPSCFLFTKILK
jgi:hypothetical protein